MPPRVMLKSTADVSAAPLKTKNLPAHGQQDKQRKDQIAACKLGDLPGQRQADHARNNTRAEG